MRDLQNFFGYWIVMDLLFGNNGYIYQIELQNSANFVNIL